jgi:hypothetical protein
VFYELDQSLRTLIRTEALNEIDAEVAFDAPTKEWAARRNTSVVDLYLYDIREDLDRRQRGLVNEYDDRGVILSRRGVPRYYKVSYLITAWTKRPEDEHRLLSSLLFCFLRNETLPKALLSGQLAELEQAVTVSIALPPPQDRSFADVWSALGGELKPSLDLVVTAPADGGRSMAAEKPVQEPLAIGMGDHAGQFGDPRRRKFRLAGDG